MMAISKGWLFCGERIEAGTAYIWASKSQV